MTRFLCLDNGEILNSDSINSICMSDEKIVINLNHSIKTNEKTIANFIFLTQNEFSKFSGSKNFIEVRGNDRIVYINPKNIYKVKLNELKNRIEFYFNNLVSKPKNIEILIPDFMFVSFGKYNNEAKVKFSEISENLVNYNF